MECGYFGFGKIEFLAVKLEAPIESGWVLGDVRVVVYAERMSGVEKEGGSHGRVGMVFGKRGRKRYNVDRVVYIICGIRDSFSICCLDNM